MRIHSCTLALALLIPLAGTARADKASDAAAHADAGKKAFAAEHYPEAITEFRAANALVSDPKLLYAIAQAQRLAGDCAGAIESYEAFLATKPDAKLSEYSEANITRCKQDLASKPKPEPVPEPTPVPEPMPTPTAAPVEPLTEPGTGPVDHDGGGRPWYRDWLGNALVVGGVGASAAGVVLFVQGRNKAQKVNDAGDHASFLDARDAASSALTRQRIGIGVAAAGAALIVGGILHYRFSSSGKEVRITAVPTDGGAAVFAGMDL